MKKVSWLLVLLLLLSGLSGFIFGGCGVREESADYYPGAEPAKDMVQEAYMADDRVAEYSESAPESDGSTINDSVKIEKIIKRGNIDYIADSVTAKVEEINETVKKYDAVIMDSSFSKYNDRERASLNIRFDSELFESVYEELGQLDNLVSKNSFSQDVTMEYVDLQRRLEVYQTQEARYLEMLEKAENVEEMLEVERELVRIRLEVESIEGILKHYDSITDYSYIDISVEQRQAVGGTAKVPENIWEEFVFSFTEGWIFFTAFVVSFMSSVIWALPFIIIIVIVLALILFIKRKRKKKKNKPDTE